MMHDTPQKQIQTSRLTGQTFKLASLFGCGVLLGIFETLVVFEWGGLSAFSGGYPEPTTGYILVSGMALWLIGAVAFVALIYGGWFQPSRQARMTPSTSDLKETEQKVALSSVQDLQRQRTDLRTTVATLTTQQAELGSKVTELKRTRTRLKKQIAELANRQKELKTDIQDLESQARELEQLVAQQTEFESEITRLKRTRTRLKNQLAKLESKRAELVNRQIELEESIEQLEGQYQELKDKLDEGPRPPKDLPPFPGLEKILGRQTSQSEQGSDK